MPHVKSLTDEELRRALTNRGVQVGPIVGSTRQLYEKKLTELRKMQPEKALKATKTLHQQTQGASTPSNRAYSAVSLPDRAESLEKEVEYLRHQLKRSSISRRHAEEVAFQDRAKVEDLKAEMVALKTENENLDKVADRLRAQLEASDQRFDEFLMDVLETGNATVDQTWP